MTLLANLHRTIRRVLFSTAALLLSLPIAALETGGESKPVSSSARTVLESDPVAAGNLLQMTLGLAFVLVVIVLAAWMMRRFGGFHASSDGSMKIIGGLSVGTRERIILVEVGDTQLLLGVAPGRIEMLHQLETPIVVDSNERSGGFAEMLTAAVKQVRKS